MDLDVAGLSDDELMVQLTTWAGRVAAGEALVLRLLGELLGQLVSAAGSPAATGPGTCTPIT